MNVLNDYTRVSTQLIENLTLDANNDAELTIVRAGNSTDTQKNPLSVKLYNTYQPIAPTNWTFNADGAWTTYCDLATTLKGSGTYLIQISYGAVIYCGYFAFNPDSPSIEDEIILHASGNLTSDGQTRNRLYAKTSVSGGRYVLQIATKDKDGTTNDNDSLTIKFRKLL